MPEYRYDSLRHKEYSLDIVKKLVDESNLNQVDSNGYKIYEYNRFAWVKNIGYAIIKSIEIEINGRLIR